MRATLAVFAIINLGLALRCHQNSIQCRTLIIFPYTMAATFASVARTNLFLAGLAFVGIFL